jgi:hypothetical protein
MGGDVVVVGAGCGVVVSIAACVETSSAADEGGSGRLE